MQKVIICWRRFFAETKSLTKQEIAEHFCCSGILVEADNHRMTRFMVRAEQEGIVCSGEDKGGKYTYALFGRTSAACAGDYKR